MRYLAAWNEPEAKRRREPVAKAWIDDGTYVDGARDGSGHDDLHAMIATSLAHFPSYRLRLASAIETHHAYLRFSWVAGGRADAPLYIKGTDFVVVAGDGRVRSAVAFVGACLSEGGTGQAKRHGSARIARLVMVSTVSPR